MKMLDDLILTASNERQAAGYRARLTSAERQGRLPAGCRWLVVPDPGGHRAGSGGSTLVALTALVRTLIAEGAAARSVAGLLRNRRVLLLHSGGDARRLCAYAAEGKIFTPMPVEDHSGRAVPLLHLVLDDLLGLAAPAGGHVLVAAGDVLLGIGEAKINFEGNTLVAVGARSSMRLARRHGVFVRDGEGQLLDVLQKPMPGEARERGAIDVDNSLLVDTGLVSFPPGVAGRWMRAAGVGMQNGRLVIDQRGTYLDIHSGRLRGLDLYGHLLPSLGSRARLDVPKSDPDVAKRSRRLLKAIGKTPARVEVVEDCEFLHFGTTREYLERLTTRNRAARRYRFRSDAGAVGGSSSDRACFINSALRAGAIVLAGTAVVERCAHKGVVSGEGDNVVVGLPSDWRWQQRLTHGQCITALPVGRSDWAAIIYDVDDDFKTLASDGGTWRGASMSTMEFVRTKETLWDARLWVVGPLAEVVAAQRWMSTDGAPGRRWQSAQRCSIAQIMKRVNQRRIMAQRSAIGETVVIERVGERFDRPAMSVVDAITTPEGACTIVERCRSVARRTGDDLNAARALMLAAEVVRRYPKAAPRWEMIQLRRQAMVHVGKRVAAHVPEPPRLDASNQSARTVIARAPLRIDLAGGWSDTPPICHEHGGAVCNIAVRLEGRQPIEVRAERTREPVIRIASDDLRRHAEYAEMHDVLDYDDPNEWTSLVKAGLALAGITLPDRRKSLQRRLERWGGGLSVTTSSGVPRGSGLGTSSILAGALLACLSRTAGHRWSHRKLVEQTSLLEQMLGSRGGWQDQVGGIVGGAKLVRTRPGNRQVPRITVVPLSDQITAELHERCILVYTGMQRMARDILETVVGRYLANDPVWQNVLPRLKSGAEQMAGALRTGRFDDFATIYGEYWALKCTLDPAATNAQIDAMVDPVRRWLTAWGLPGAGGGGFLFLIARDPAGAGRIRKHFARLPSSSPIREFAFEIDHAGLGCTAVPGDV